MSDTTLKVLLICATLTLLFSFFSTNENQWIEGASIYFAVAFIAFFASSNDYMREKQFMKNHKEILNEEVMVIRGQYGTSMSIKCTDLVVGDIVQIETGMKVPADCVIIEGLDITVDERVYNDDVEKIVKKTISNGQNHKDNPDTFLLSQT